MRHTASMSGALLSNALQPAQLSDKRYIIIETA